ncbi:hypothetical protein KJ973_02180 [Patescibacteria group bacterium]|nr:hypothetical protein [Patescibacteria group bacterium]MBU1246993.1 hypothetical protein [Patescibacteria group bacterium]MBU1519476.1 hypothetical protein [Patescibacteria group bacterium]MBU1730431.1 hypothetical protein [Patescibacteria group bacterium]MBU1956665.1 hypothetical protein [Patescibacteria group bacterium]
MAVIEMQKIQLLVHKTAVTDVLRAVQKLGVLQFTQVLDEEKNLKQKEKTVFEFNYVSSRLDFAVKFLSLYAKPTNKLVEMLEGSRIRVTGKHLYEVANSFYYNDIIDETQDIEVQQNALQAKLKQLAEEEKTLLPWVDMDIALSVPLDTNTTRTMFLLGKKKRSIDFFLEDIKKEECHFNIIEVTEKNFVFTSLKTDVEMLEKKVRENELEIVSLSKRRGTAREEIVRIERAKIKTIQGIEKLKNRAIELAKQLPELKMVNDFIYWKKQKHNFMSSSLTTQEVFVFEGWCPTKVFQKLEQVIANKTSIFSLKHIEPLEEEAVPVEIENSGLIKPFEAVTRLYGLPGHRDIDPTIFLSLFFFVFFGFALTDTGYGVILFFVTASLLAFFKLPKDIKPLIMLLMLGGISTSLAGMLFGGYFGIDMSTMPTWLQAIQQFDPIKNPIAVFGLSLGLGVIHIVFGLILQIVSKAKNNDLVGGLLDQGPWVFTFCALGLFIASKTSVIAINPEISLYILYAGIASIVLLTGHREKGAPKKIMTGAMGLYSVVGFFSDILSYSRLFALGLATTAIAFAVNMIAVLAQDMVPVVGTLVMVIILVIGHLFNLVINTLGAFIHSARLQFVEFFSKFISGSGVDFKPFKREERYVIIE